MSSDTTQTDTTLESTPVNSSNTEWRRRALFALIITIAYVIAGMILLSLTNSATKMWLKEHQCGLAGSEWCLGGKMATGAFIVSMVMYYLVALLIVFVYDKVKDKINESFGQGFDFSYGKLRKNN